jgi:hypothetical protein
MKNISKFWIALIVVSLFIIQNAFSQEIKANEFAGDGYVYSIINNLTLIQLKEKALTLKVFETGGGDPALNGNILILNISEWDEMDGNCYIWETGINVLEVKSIKTKDNKCIIECTEHQVNDGILQVQSVQYIISYYFDENNRLQDMIKVEKQKL